MEDVLVVMRQLTYDERMKARTVAAERIAGPEHKFEDFRDTVVSRFPPWMERLIVILSLILLAAAFVVSAIRIYDVGYTVALDSVPSITSARVIGGSMILLAEIGMVIFSLAFAVLENSKTSRYILLGGMVIATAIAVSGNVTAAHPPAIGHERFVVSWLEALAPPLLVLGTAYVLKERMLEPVKDRQQQTINYREAVQKREQLLQDPTAVGNWREVYVEALKDQIYRVNGRSSKAKAVRAHLTTAQWAALLHRELDEESKMQALYAEMAQPIEQRSAPKRKKRPQVAPARPEKTDKSGGDTAVKQAPPITAVNIVAQPLNGAWVAVCPVCGERYEKPTEHAALQACRGHQRAHMNEPVISSNGKQ